MLNITAGRRQSSFLIAFVCLCAVRISLRRYGCEVPKWAQTPRRLRLIWQGGSHIQLRSINAVRRRGRSAAATKRAHRARRPSVAHGAAGDRGMTLECA